MIRTCRPSHKELHTQTSWRDQRGSENAIVSLSQTSSMTKHVMLSSQNLLGLNQPQNPWKNIYSHTLHLASISREGIITHTHTQTLPSYPICIYTSCVLEHHCMCLSMWKIPFEWKLLKLSGWMQYKWLPSDFSQHFIWFVSHKSNDISTAQHGPIQDKQQTSKETIKSNVVLPSYIFAAD